MDSFSIIIPFCNGHETIDRLIRSLPRKYPLIIVDDQSDIPLAQEKIDRRWEHPEGNDIEVIRMDRKGYFSGAVNRGIQACKTDVLILNQDTWFENMQWLDLIEENREEYGMIGERVRGNHPAFGKLGYIHGTFMFLRRDVIDAVGLLNESQYPLWGSTAEYQWRVARKDFEVLPLESIPGFHHERSERSRFGSSIKELLKKEPEKEEWLIRTPPLISVIVPCYNYGIYLKDCINSLIGGPTSLGEMSEQTIQSFEIIIVDDASTDDSMDYVRDVTDMAKGIRSYHLEKNVGTARALNYGISKAVGKYITFLSADDMREADSLEKLVQACEQHPHSFAYDDVWLVNQHGRVKKWKVEEYDFEKLIWKNQIHAGILFPREAWVETGGYPAVMNDGREDWAFNVALGVKGWCGVHVKNFGYLYRREGQNRTERNTTPFHRERFLAKIMNLFPEIYKGYRPMACCGKGGNSKKNVGINSTMLVRSMGGLSMSNGNSLVGATGMEKVEYLGEQMNFTVTGDVTNVKYIFGKDRPRGWIDKRDLGSRAGKNGFLSKKDRNGKWLYRSVNGDNGDAELEPAQGVEVVSVPQGDGPEVIESMGMSIMPGAAGSIHASGILGVVERNIQPSEIGKNKIIFPDPMDLTADEVRALNLTHEQWEALYASELAGRSRKGLTLYLEELIASWER